MTKPLQSHTRRDWLPLVLGLLLALGLLEFARTQLVVKLEEAALGQDTQFVFGADGAPRTMCMDAKDGGQVPAKLSRRQSGRLPCLWLGNSQLPAINRVRPATA